MEQNDRIPPNDVKLSELLGKEIGYYRSMLEISKEEVKKISLNYPFPEIKQLLKKKKILLSCISEIEEDLAPLKKTWQAKVDRSDSLSIQINEQLGILSQILTSILDLDLKAQIELKNYLGNLEQDYHSI